jgi:hypothetical protein
VPSSINPLHPIPGLPYTQQERANFQAAKDEIEALQVSTDPDGFKLAAFSTPSLGTAMGTTATGRIAYDLDKAVIVRDTTYWLEMGQRRPLRGSVAIRPAIGSLPDSGSFVNLFYNTTALKLQLDTGASWVDVGPGAGGGGGETLTEDIVPSMGFGNTQTVTHTSVPLTDGGIKFSALATIPGATHTAGVFPTIFENIHNGVATWVQDAGTLGHFSVAPGVNVTTNDLIDIGGTIYGMVINTPPGTNPSSVTLTASLASSAINAINAVQSLGAEIRPASVAGVYTICPVVSWGYTGVNVISSGQVAAMYILQGLTGSLYGTGIARAAVSLDAAATWLTYNGSAWVAVIPANLEADGLQCDAGVKDNTGVAIPADDGSPGATGWGELRLLMQAAGAGLQFRVMLGIRNTFNVETEFYNVYLNWQDEPSYQALSIGRGGFGGGFDMQVTRISDTQATFYYSGLTPTINDVHCQVWI